MSPTHATPARAPGPTTRSGRLPENDGPARGRWTLIPWRMRTFDLYVTRTFIFSYVVCAVSFLGLFVTIEAFAKLDRFLKQETPLLETLARYHIAMGPTIYVHYVGPILTAAAGI